MSENTAAESIPRPLDMPYVYTPEEAATLLQINLRFLKDKTNRGEFPHLRVNQSTMRFTSEHLVAIMKMFEVTPAGSRPTSEPETVSSSDSEEPEAGEGDSRQAGVIPDDETDEEREDRERREELAAMPLDSFPGGSLRAKRRMRKMMTGLDA